VYLATPIEPYASIRSEVGAVATPAERYSFYLTAVAAAGLRIAKLRETQPVICDRWVPTTQLWHQILGVEIHRDLRYLMLPEPTAVLLVTCREDVRQAGLDLRGRDANDLAEGLNGREQRLLADYRSLDLLEIDATDPDVRVIGKRALFLAGNAIAHEQRAPRDARTDPPLESELILVGDSRLSE
jgi:hypothetical protein